MPLDEENRAALLHCQNLQSGFKQLITAAQTGNCTILEIVKSLTSMSEDIEGMSNYLSTHLDPQYYNEVRSADCDIATRALSIPELLELTLAYTTPADMASMEQVNRASHQIITGSSKLQKVFLNMPSVAPGNSGGRGRTIFYDLFPGFEVEPSYSTVIVTINRANCADGVPRIGSRWLTMSLCQPPVTTLHVERRCEGCGEDTRVRAREDPITSTTGLTVQDVYEEARRVFSTQEVCETCTSDSPDGQPVMIDVDVVTFVGRMIDR